MSAFRLIRPVLSLAFLVGAGLCVSRMAESWEDINKDIANSPDIWSLSFADRLVVIDAGHGGQDGGTAGHGALEKDLTLKIARKVEEYLKKDGIPVLLTRQNDVYVDLDERSEIANRHGAAVFLSIHLNADSATEVAGVETYYSSHKPFNEIASLKRSLGMAPETPLKDIRGEWLAGLLQRRVCAAIRSADRGVRDSRYLVVMNTKCPAVLLECGYLSNAAESKKLQQPTTHDQIALAAADAVKHYLTAITLNPGRGLILNSPAGGVTASNLAPPNSGPQMAVPALPSPP